MIRERETKPLPGVPVLLMLIIAARQRIVEGAVGMVEMALEMLSKRDIVTLDNERKAAMVSRPRRSR